MPARRDRAWGEYSEQFQKQVLPKLLSSSILLAIYDGDDRPSVQTATEIGMMLLRGKPLVLVVLPGTVIPPGLSRAADETVVVDPSTSAGQEVIIDTLDRLGKRLQLPSDTR